MTVLSESASEYLLAFADDEHLMGQRYTEWIGVAPFLEEDLALASIGQDELGHALMLYAIVAGNDDATIDQLALLRDVDDYRSSWLVEADLPNWEHALIRHWLYDAAEELRWGLVDESTVPGLADVAKRAAQEELYHRRHADALVDALLGVPKSAERLEVALTEVLPLALGLFEAVDGEAEAVTEGVAKAPFHSQRAVWEARVVQRFAKLDPGRCTAPDQDRRRRRSPDFVPLMARMREVYDLDPSAVW
jgi:ring-1,2-phenylacetyl-CoA epoxidase subunit PaaC